MTRNEPVYLLPGLLLGLVVVLTHGQHALTPYALPPATWAAFFAGGMILQRARWWGVGLALVLALDVVAVTWGGVSDFCLSPAYVFMVPAYGVLWLAGRVAARHLHWQLRDLAMMALCLSSIVLAEILASGSFYLLSDRVPHANLTGLPAYLIAWGPQTLKAFLFWIGVFALTAGVTQLFRGTRFSASRSGRA